MCLSVLLLHSIPLYESKNLYLLKKCIIYLGVFSLGLLTVGLPRTSVYKSLYNCVLTFFLVNKYLEMEHLGHMVPYIFNFLRTYQLFSKVVIPFYIPISSAGEFQFLISSPILDIACCFGLTHSSGDDAVCWCSFNVQVSNEIFLCAYLLCIYLLWSGCWNC